MKHTNTSNIKSELKSKGYVFLPSLLPNLPTHEVAQKIGVPIQNEKIGGTHRLSPKTEEESKPNLYSGNFGLNDFPFHTDMAHWFKPPHYLLLRCIKGSKDVYTKVLHSKLIFDQLPQNKIDMALFKPRKTVNGRLILLRFKQPTDESYLVRWDQLFLTPSNSAAKDISKILADIDNTEPVQLLLNKPGDTLIIDNYKTLHGRSGVPKKSSDRIIERIYLNNLDYGN